MKAMILAAGKGLRLRPITDKTPKPLIEVFGKPLIVHHLERLAKAGVNDVVINLFHLGHLIEETLGTGSAFGLKIHYLKEAELLDTGGGILNALPLLGSKPFWAINGDIFCDYDFEKLPRHLSSGLAHVVLVPNPQHNPNGDFGLSEQNLQNTGTAKFTFAGINVYSPALFAEQKPGAFSVIPLIRTAADAQQVSAELYEGNWNDVGSPKRLEKLLV